MDLVLFDGEELVYGGGQNQTGEYFLGSKAFAEEYKKGPKDKARYVHGIVLDMVGDRDLVIDKEPHSLEFAPKLVDDVWAVAKALKIPQFRDREGRAVLDDHLRSTTRASRPSTSSTSTTPTGTPPATCPGRLLGRQPLQGG